MIVKAATTASSDAAKLTDEVDAFAKRVKELYDDASDKPTVDVLAIAAKAEEQKKLIVEVMKNAESVKKNSDELIKQILEAKNKASDLVKIAGNDRNDAESLHLSITPNFTADEILQQLDKAKKIESSVTMTSKDAKTLSELAGAKL